MQGQVPAVGSLLASVHAATRTPVAQEVCLVSCDRCLLSEWCLRLPLAPLETGVHRAHPGPCILLLILVGLFDRELQSSHVHCRQYSCFWPHRVSEVGAREAAQSGRMYGGSTARRVLLALSQPGFDPHHCIGFPEVTFELSQVGFQNQKFKKSAHSSEASCCHASTKTRPHSLTFISAALSSTLSPPSLRPPKYRKSRR